MAQNKLDVVVSLKDEFSKGMGSLNQGFSDMSTRAKLAFAAVGAAALAGAIAVDNARAEMVKLTGASGTELASLRQNFSRVALSVPNDLGQVAKAIGEVNTRLDLSGKQLEQTSEDFLNFARISNTDVQVAVRNVSRMMGDWGISVNETSSILDKLTHASQISGVEMSNLTSLAVQYGVQFRSVGFEIDEVVAMLAKFEKEGVATEKMMGGLSMALGRMAQAGKEPREEFGLLINRIKEADTEGEALREAIDMLGTRAGPDFALAVREGRFELEEMIEAMSTYDGALNRTARESRTFQDSTNQLKNAWALFSDEILAVPLGMLADGLVDTIDEMLEWRDATDRAKDSARRYAEQISKSHSDIDTAINMTAGISREFFEKRQEITEGDLKLQEMRDKRETMFASYARDRLDREIRDFEEAQSDKTQALYQWMRDNEEALASTETRTAEYVATVERLGMQEASFRTAILNEMQVEDARVRQAIFDKSGELTEDQVKDFIAKYTDMKDEGLGAMEGLKDGTIGALEETRATGTERFKGFVSDLVEDWNKAEGRFRALTLTMNIAQRIMEGARQIGGALFGRATGGTVREGNPYIVGERGRELFVPNQTGTIIPNHNLGGGTTINNIVINTNGYVDKNAFERMADEVLMKKLRKNIIPV